MEGKRERMRRVVVCVIGRENDYYGSENARLNTTEFIHSEFIYNQILGGGGDVFASRYQSSTLKEMEIELLAILFWCCDLNELEKLENFIATISLKSVETWVFLYEPMKAW